MSFLWADSGRTVPLKLIIWSQLPLRCTVEGVCKPCVLPGHGTGTLSALDKACPDVSARPRTYTESHRERHKISFVLNQDREEKKKIFIPREKADGNFIHIGCKKGEGFMYVNVNPLCQI